VTGIFHVRAVVDAEHRRRRELREAIGEIVVWDDKALKSVSISALRRQLSTYFGAAMAEGATFADLAGAIAEIGGGIRERGFVHIRLRPPSREAMRRIVAKWNKGLPKGEAPLIRRLRSQEDAGFEDLSVDGRFDFLDLVSSPVGTLYQKEGVYHQIPPETAALVTRSGGVWNKPGQTITRKRRFPSYIERLRAFLEKEPGNPFAKNEAMISAVDRQILEYIIEGKTLRWIAQEIGMKKATIHKRVVKIRNAAGIPGPGPGR
jgi:hypothetical protein